LSGSLAQVELTSHAGFYTCTTRLETDCVILPVWSLYDRQAGSQVNDAVKVGLGLSADGYGQLRPQCARKVRNSTGYCLGIRRSLVENCWRFLETCQLVI